ncbi:hypothetical protein J3R30DRAFT_3701261 [Lentinula aciculospora]|uniref:G-protein coupled receptors family 1 profile domain-containing protein n=1 Tax=Lentinula aciculospora TaxID=153920 RepID=A0A9W9DPC6_9AGAR|nr:hypothetical protein J3R30DRAFT_3701261 [Lentinula aciculospora]
MANSTVSPIPSSEMAGAIVVNAFAILSTLSLFCIFLRVSWLGILRVLGENVAQTLFNTQLGYYAACLLIANMINGIAGLLGLPFLVNRAITDNAICTSQAAVMQVGNIATAYFTVAIAFHTFNSLVLRKRQSIYVYGPTIVLGWTVSLFLGFLPLISNMGPVYGPSGLACGVRASLKMQLFFFHLFPVCDPILVSNKRQVDPEKIFLAAVLSVILYTLIFLVLRGFLVIRGGVRVTPDSTYQQFVTSIARSMLWYPAAYILLLVPYSVTRLLSIRGFAIPFQVTVFAFVWVVDALLLFNTFRVLSPAFETKSATGDKGDLESFGTAETFKRFTLDSQKPLQLNLTEAMIKEYRGTSLSSPSSYNASSTVSYPERAASAQSSYRHITTTEEVNRQITPVSILNESIVVEAPGSVVASRPPAPVPNPDHTRQESQSSTLSLPVPPRRTPPPSHLIIDNPSSSIRSNPFFTSGSLPRPAPARPSLSPRNSTMSSPTRSLPFQEERVSAASTYSSGSVDLDVAGWLSNQNVDGSIPSGLRNQPMLSAVRPNFPTNDTYPNPLDSPAARLRPLLLASVERTGSMVLAEQYNRMYSTPHS